jgi:orotate phosphoribosyltransferase
MSSIYSRYLSEQLGLGLKKTKEETVKVIKHCIKNGLVFDAIAFQGMSGALVAPAVAIELEKPLIMIRKNESCHSAQIVEGAFTVEKYIIIDDFVSTGRTIFEIFKKIKENFLIYAKSYEKPRCVAIFLYNQTGISIGSDKIKMEYPDCNIINVGEYKFPLKKVIIY